MFSGPLRQGTQVERSAVVAAVPGLGLGSGSGLSGRLFSLFGLFALAFGVVLALAVAVTLAFGFAITFPFRGFFFLEVLGGGFLDVFVLAVVRVEAFDEGRVFGVYHQFYDAPFNFIAYLAFAKWQNPDLFSDLDPEGVWDDFHDKYMPWESQGVFITGI